MTGKTTYLLGIVERLLAEGVHPTRIAYVSFTRRATKEAQTRAATRFGFHETDMPWFRTIHSLAFHQTGISTDRLIKKKHLQEIGAKLGFDFNNDVDEDMGDVGTGGQGDQMLFLDNLARITGRSLEETFFEQNEHHNYDFDQYALSHFSQYYRRYKGVTGMVDYTDAIEMFVEHAYPPDVDYLIVDEGQDLSYMQWMVVEKIADVVKQVWIAGDDDQAIFRWAGADVEKFLSLEGRETHLEQSYRVPARVHRVARNIVNMISRRRQKTFNPKVDAVTGRTIEGKVRFTSFDEEVFAKEGTWFFLARHGYQLKNLIALCEEQGWFYAIEDKAARNLEDGSGWSNKSKDGRAIIAWESLRKGKQFRVGDVVNALKMARAPGVETLSKMKPDLYVGPDSLPKIDFKAARPWYEALVGMKGTRSDYFRRALGNGERITVHDEKSGLTTYREPRIRISTIHGVKGGEADGVYLTTDISGSTSDAMLSRGVDDEARVFYVGATRAKDHLVIKNPVTGKNFEIQETA